MVLSDLNCKYCSPMYQFSSRIILSNKHWVANFDNHPKNPGHMKLISKKHRISLEELTDEELISFLSILREAKSLIRSKHNPDGWNIGYNEGKAAGQTVFHLHFHIIPRYEGDTDNPIGGIRTINITRPGGNYHSV